MIGLDSSSLHTNGYTLARKIVFDTMGLKVKDEFPGEDRSVGEVLLDVHRSYLKDIEGLLAEDLLNGLAHITGGGIEGNLPRIFPNGIGARIDTTSWEVPNVFKVLKEGGNVAGAEMYRVFNMGIGMILAVREDDVARVLAVLEEGQSDCRIIGRVEIGEGVRLE